MTDREVILDALAAGLTIKAAADRFDMPQNEVRALLKEEAERCYDGAEMRQEWALASRRLKRMELAFHERAMEQMDASLAVIALKANERRASLSGAGSAEPSHLLMVMNQRTIEEAPTSTQQLRNALDSVLGITHRERQLLDRHELEGDTSPEVLAEINQLRAGRGKPSLDEDKPD